MAQPSKVMAVSQPVYSRIMGLRDEWMERNGRQVTVSEVLEVVLNVFERERQVIDAQAEA